MQYPQYPQYPAVPTSAVQYPDTSTVPAVSTVPYSTHQQYPRVLCSPARVLIIAQQDKSEGDKVTNGAVGNSDDNDALLDNLDIDWEFTSRTSPLTPVGRDSPASMELDYSSDKSETGSVKALGDKEDKDSKSDNSFFGLQDDKTTAPQEITIAAKKPVLTQRSTRHNGPHRKSS